MQDIVDRINVVMTTTHADWSCSSSSASSSSWRPTHSRRIRFLLLSGTLQ